MLLRLAPLVLGLAAFAHASVITVDNSGAPADFSDLQAAVDAASDGDILLVQRNPLAGYGPIVIDGKGLVLQSDGSSGSVQIEPSIVRNLGPDQSVVLRQVAFSVGISGSDEVPSLTLLDCEGQVALDTCVVFGRFGNPFAVSDNEPEPALFVQRSDRVAITNSSVRGGAGEVGPGAVMQTGSPAIRVDNGTLTITDTIVEGGAGASPIGNLTPPDGTPAGTGGPALDVGEGALWITGSVVEGGRGGSGFEYPGFCQPGGDGGPGLVMTNADASVRLREVLLAGGDGGSGGGGQIGPPCAPDGSPGPDTQILAGTLSTLPTPSATYVAPSPLREGQAGTHLFTGEPGDMVVLWLSLEPALIPLLGREGVFHAAFPTVKDSGFVFGTLNAAGERAVDLTVPPISGFDGLAVHIQTASGPAGALKIGDWSVQVVLDDSF